MWSCDIGDVIHCLRRLTARQSEIILCEYVAIFRCPSCALSNSSYFFWELSNPDSCRSSVQTLHTNTQDRQQCITLQQGRPDVNQFDGCPHVGEDSAKCRCDKGQSFTLNSTQSLLDVNPLEFLRHLFVFDKVMKTLGGRGDPDLMKHCLIFLKEMAPPLAVST